MAGIIAMASIIEDFETQPCKKPRKDVDPPAVKTITNYFSPLSKPMDKPFSPPRCNNIRDYFSRKSPPSREKTSTPEQTKESRQAALPTGDHVLQEKVAKQPGKPSQKRSRKSSKANRRLHQECVTPSDNLVIIEEPTREQNDDPASQLISSSGIMGSDTAALLAQFTAETCGTEGTTEGNDSETAPRNHRDISKREAAVKLKKTCEGQSPIVPLKAKSKRGKPTVKHSKKDQAKPQRDEVELNLTKVDEADQTLCDVSMEVNVDEASQLNSSTVTISFEEFVQSQGTLVEEEEKADAQDRVKEPSEIETEQLDMLKANKTGDSCELQKVSPRTLTIQAEVHAISVNPASSRPVGKMASIFTRGKGQPSPTELKLVSSPRLEFRPERDPTKRKSNVVLQEEDLELNVVESESTPKCNQSERNQFMSAFRKPALEKPKPGKSQAKPKQDAEETPEETGKLATQEETVSEEKAGPGKNGAQRKPARKGKKKALEEEQLQSVASPATPPTRQQEDSGSQAAVEPTSSCTASTPTSTLSARRSRRETSLRPATVKETDVRVKKSRSQKKLKVAEIPHNSPLQISTPKTQKPKRRVFKAEMLSPPDEKCSPIRMRFSRVILNSSSLSEGGNDFEILSPIPSKSSRASKKRKQAKKLVKKARAIQQNKKAAAADGEASSVQRSSRSRAAKDSVVCVEDDQTGSAETGQEKSKAKKRLRSLNDVLGRNAAVNKENKTSTVFKAKKASRTSAVSIFDEGSGDGSENSQDDVAFRARKEFLKSGLPESFKKQIAKSIATKEAYSFSCSSFQPVVHVQQTPQDCPLWSLQWPLSPLLHGLRDLCSLPSNPLPSHSGSFASKTEASSRVLCQRGSGWREEFSECVCQLLMEEVSASNPAFPVQRFLSSFLKKRAEHQQQCSTSELEPVSVPSLPEPVGGKRKRADEDEKRGIVAKKPRAHRSDKETRVGDDDSLTPDPEPPQRVGRVSRAQRRKLEQQQQEEEKEKAHPSIETTPGPCQDDPIVILDDSALPHSPGKEDAVREDVLWTEKYQPQHSTDVIGNTASVRKLHSWLKEWKRRADREERKKLKEKKQEEGSNDSDWDCGEEESQDGEDTACNALLITGPTGVGKTAAIYACAQELGFKVFEVNASCQRSGRQILSQLKEATQSHQVDIQGVNVHKPCYFNSYVSSSSGGSPRSGSSPRKVNSPRRVVSSPRKPPQSPRGAKRGSLAPTSLANFFKLGRPPSKEPASTGMTPPTAAPKKTVTVREDVSRPKALPVKTPACTTAGEEQSKKTATSLILFEEVDVILDDDAGFLAAVKTFMATTKRPVILTTSDPSFRTVFDGCFEEICFKTPSLVNVCSYLQLLCLAENVRTDPRDMSSLLSLTRCDIRQSLLHLQFWTRSSGGRCTDKPLSKAGEEMAREVALKTEEPREVADGSVCEVAAPVPPCDTGCTENMLGLWSVQPDRGIQDLLKNFRQPEEPGLWEMLTDSWKRGMGLLYSNLELLLPLPLTVLTLPPHRPIDPLPNTATKDQPSDEPPQAPGSQPDTVPHSGLLQAAESSDECSPVKVSKRMKTKKQLHCLEDHSDSDSEEGFLSLCKPDKKPTDSSQAQNRETDEQVEVDLPPAPVKIKRVPLTQDERTKSIPVSHCLGSLADFLDNMSFLDSSLRLHTSPAGGHLHKRPPSLSSRAEVKDGMTDEPREGCEEVGWAETERAVEIQAALEAMSFHRCRSRVAEAWGKAQALEGELGVKTVAELTLPVAAHRHGIKLTQDSLCKPKVLQSRSEVTETVLSRAVIGHQGNRQAAALDYMPALRTICRAELLKEQGKLKRRFLHYLNAIHLGLPKSTLQYLAEDFP
ncbi:ATPase family AAA domain-containing protein 5 [Aplochiton taeniatus]